MKGMELPRYFEDIGARLVVHTIGPVRSGSYEMNIASDKFGEHFRLGVTATPPDFQVLQIRKDERHLLLYAGGTRKERLLCGHDERHWFVAAVGEPVSTVMAARRALLPRQLRQQGLTNTTLTSRRNDVFKRQGEWFFVPVAEARLRAAIATSQIHRREPIQRGRSKPHLCDELVRFGGSAVVLYRGREYSRQEWADVQLDPGFRVRGRVEHRVKDMSVYVRGGIKHPDHATIVLHDWHQVLLNGEIVSSNVTFYD